MNPSSTLPVLLGCGVPAAAPAATVIGSKAHHLARMAALGLRVPPAFVLGTAWCGQADALDRAVWQSGLRALESACGLRFGDARRPLLLSVRSGAPVSMPGMMETLLDIGLNDETVAGLVRLTGNPRLAWDAYRRLVAGYGEVVLGLPAELFEADLRGIAGETGDERELDFSALRALARRHLATVRRESGQPFPQDVHAQLEGAVRAVFSSWSSDKARAYRAMHGIAEDMGTAVTVQRMVFGNAGGTSGAGVGFSRHPSTGEPEPWVDFLFNAQGEDVVSGRRSAQGHAELDTVLPGVWAELVLGVQRLETALADMQDFEFTVEDGVLFFLQTRSGKRTPQAAVRIALDLLEQGVISEDEALRRTAGFDDASLRWEEVVARDGDALQPLAIALSACTGVACGPVALDEASAQSFAARGEAPVLVRTSAETGDIAALDLAAGLLTQRGARTSHAAVVARQLGKVCLVSCPGLTIDTAARRIRVGGREFAEGELLALDGHSGAVHAGPVATRQVEPPGLLARLCHLRRMEELKEKQDGHC